MTTTVNVSAIMSTTATTPPMMAMVLSELDDEGWFPPPVGPTGTAKFKILSTCNSYYMLSISVTRNSSSC